MTRPLLLVLAATATLHAQEPAPTQPRPVVLIDTVVATVNDSAIMHSELLTLAAGRVRTLETSGRRLRSEDREAIYKDELRDRIDHHTWAQAAKTFGVASPEQVEALFQRELEREEQNQVRDLGSYQAFSRALQNQGRTWQTYVREQRVDKMADFAKGFSVGMRLQRQSNLYVTPRMLRETFERVKSRFVHGADAKVALIAFGGADATANATKAAAIWQTEDLTSRALAQRFSAATPLDNMGASALIPQMAAFALAGPINKVSEPVLREGIVQLAKIVTFVPARSGAFEDLDVQDELRILCERLVEEEFRMQALARAHQRTEVWIGRLPR